MLITHLNSDMTFSWVIPDLDLDFIRFIAKKVDTQVAPSRFRSFLRTELFLNLNLNQNLSSQFYKHISSAHQLHVAGTHHTG